MNVNFRLLTAILTFLLLPTLLHGDIATTSTIPVPCDGVAYAFTITNTGEGYGATRDEALAQARSQAKKKSDIEQDSITCANQECRRIVGVTTPDYDSKKPTFRPWPKPGGPGFVASAEISREITVTCKTQ